MFTSIYLAMFHKKTLNTKMEISGGDSSNKQLEVEILYEGLASQLRVVQVISLVNKVKGLVLKKLR
jgi:hypothetical protein